MKGVILALVLLVTNLLQSVVLVQLPILGLVPDLLLCLVLSLAFRDGYLSAAMVGMAGGLITDILYGWPVGAMGLIYLLMGVIAGTVCSRLDTGNALVAVVLTGALSLVKEFLVMIAAKLVGVSFSVFGVFLHGMLVTALLTAVFMVPIFLLMSKLCAMRLMRRRSENEFD